MEDSLGESNVYWTVHHCNSWRMKDQLDVTCYFISLIMCSTCFLLQAEAQLQPAKRTPPNISRSKSSNTQRTENKTTYVVIHQHSRKLLKMDILISETCWTHNKWNKIASVIKLVFHSSTIRWMIRVTLAVNIRNVANKAVENPLWKIKFWENNNKIYLKAKGFRD